MYNVLFCGMGGTSHNTCPWLSLCTTRHKANCTYCRYYRSTGVLCFATKSEDTVLVAGFDNWKKAHEKFVQHENSPKFSVYYVFGELRRILSCPCDPHIQSPLLIMSKVVTEVQFVCRKMKKQIP